MSENPTTIAAAAICFGGTIYSVPAPGRHHDVILLAHTAAPKELGYLEPLARAALRLRSCAREGEQRWLRTQPPAHRRSPINGCGR